MPDYLYNLRGLLLSVISGVPVYSTTKYAPPSRSPFSVDFIWNYWQHMASITIDFSCIKRWRVVASKHIRLMRHEVEMKWVTAWRVVTYNMIQFVCSSVNSHGYWRNQPSIKKPMDIFGPSLVADNAIINTPEFCPRPIPTSRRRINFDLFEDSGNVFFGKRYGEILNGSHDSAPFAGLWLGPRLRHNAISACLLYTT